MKEFLELLGLIAINAGELIILIILLCFLGYIVEKILEDTANYNDDNKTEE
jgi:hypothetical protein